MTDRSDHSGIPAGLLLLADGRFPTGGHVHSAGVESAVSIGDVRDPASLDRYLRARLATSGRVEASFAAATVQAINENRPVADLDAEYSARVPSPYLRQVSLRLGRQLLRVAARTWPGVDADLVVHHPIALGVATEAAGARPDDAAVLALHHLAGAVTTAATRLLGLDPIEMAALHAIATDRAARALLGERPWQVDHPSDLPADGGSLTEILGEHHGSLDARLFVA